MTEGLTKTRPSPSTPAGKTREYVQAAASRACAGVLLCLQPCRQGTATRNHGEGRGWLLRPPGHTASLVPCSCTAVPGMGCTPHRPGTGTLRCTPTPPFLPVSHLLDVPHPEGAHGGCFATFSGHCMSNRSHVWNHGVPQGHLLVTLSG